MSPEELLTDLTDRQREAVVHRDGPLLVLAGAGSGKTRVITRRAAWLAATGVGARAVLAITFTNKAADEMRQRIAALGVGTGMTVGTFHWFCARLLRQCAERAGVKANFSIFDQSDRLRAVKQAIAACELASERWRGQDVELRISQAKNRMLGVEDYVQQAQETGDYYEKTVGRIYRQYEQILAGNNAMDFDDLLVRVATVLGQDEDLRRQLEERYRYVLIDEYQDTNRAQYLIAHRLAQERHNICATGDPDQSIYGWRGANLGNILEFEQDYPEAKVVRLEQNYRSTKRILSAASRLIQANVRRKEKTLWTQNPEGPAVRGIICEDGADEARRIAQQIVDLQGQGTKLGNIAIFYRINSMTRLLEEALRRESLPYQIARGVEFYSRKEIKDTLAYLRVVVNPLDEVSLQRIINTPARGIGKTTLERLRDHAQRGRVGLMEALHQPQALEALGAAGTRVKAFVDLLDRLTEAAQGAGVRETLEKTLELTGLERAVLEQEGPDSEQADNLAELVSAAGDYDAQHADDGGSLQEWLAQISLVSDVDKLEVGRGAVNLMTLHAAKGLEFDVVFIAGLEDGLLPHLRAQESEEELEEERRLCFVGMTRARRLLTLSCARYRSLRGMTERTVRSRFLDDLPVEEIEWADYSGEGEADEPAPRRGRNWRPGQLLYHPEYGLGRLVRLDRASGNLTARVRFHVYGEKSFSVEQSPLEAVESEGD